MHTQHYQPPDPSEELVLTELERVVVGAMKVRLLRGDRAAASSEARRSVRSGQINACVEEVRDALGRVDDASWANDLASDLAVADAEIRAGVVDDAVADLGALVTSRSRALLVLIEVCLFVPDEAAWNGRARQRTLRDLTSALPVLELSDLERVVREVSAARRALARRQVRWGRVAVASIVGVGLGVATMGVATPVIGAAVVAGTGLSGAAATSAGLAVLGGGSLAAGGFGMAGGSMLLTGVGVVSGFGAGAAGAWLTGWSAGGVAAEALRLAVATRLVVLEEERDEELAKRVVLALQQRLNDVTAKLERLAQRLAELNEDNNRLSAENQQLRTRLRREREETRQVGAALETALDLIPLASDPSQNVAIGEGASPDTSEEDADVADDGDDSEKAS